MRKVIWSAVIVAATVGAIGCSARSTPQTGASTASAGAWQTLGLDQWRGYHNEDISAWHVDSGFITKSRGTGDLISKQQYGNFELELDWRLSKAGNAGIFYRGTEEYDHIYWSAPEYQLLDDANAPDGRQRITAAGSDYAVYPAAAGFLKPAGQWNSTRIVVQGNHVEHWLNGHQVVAYDLGSADWAAKVAASKFKAWPNYGKASVGYLGIQGDHNGELSLRNIRIRVLP